MRRVALVRPHLHPVLGSTAQEGHGPVRVCPKEAIKLISGMENLLYKERIRFRIVQHGTRVT